LTAALIILFAEKFMMDIVGILLDRSGISAIIFESFIKEAVSFAYIPTPKHPI